MLPSSGRYVTKNTYIEILHPNKCVHLCFDGDLLHTYYSKSIRISHKYFICILNFIDYYKPRITLKFNTLYLCIGSGNVCNNSIYVLFFKCTSLKIGAHGMYNILSHIYVHLLVLLPYPVVECTVMDHLKLV
jgi:hypothetical protein